MWSERQLLEHAAALTRVSPFIAATDLAQRLDVQVMRLAHVDVSQHDVLARNDETAMVEAMRPFGMPVAQAQHEEIVDGREGEFAPPAAIGQSDDGGRRMARAGLPADGGRGVVHCTHR